MPFWVVSWIGRGIGVIDGMEVVEVKRQILGATVGHPIEPTGTLWRSYSLPRGVATRLFPNYIVISCLSCCTRFLVEHWA